MREGAYQNFSRVLEGTVGDKYITVFLSLSFILLFKISMTEERRRGRKRIDRKEEREELVEFSHIFIP